jgi:hypothetical protein
MNLKVVLQGERRQTREIYIEVVLQGERRQTREIYVAWFYLYYFLKNAKLK